MIALAVLLGFAVSTEAAAPGPPPRAIDWAPVTHIYLSDFALNDACDDGRVTINRVDGDSIVGTAGTFRVDPEIQASICAFPEYFRAGVIGPDAFPDILTGQRKIHPMLSRAVATMWQAGLPAPQGQSAAGADAWLSYLWSRAFPPAARRTAADAGPTAWKAFVVGFLAHAAGDVFAHSYVNYWTGGPFQLGDNAVKHLLIEAYVGTRTPRPSSGDLPASIDPVRDRLYRVMNRADAGTVLDDQLLLPQSLETSLPRHFSDLRNDLIEYLIAYSQTDDIFASVLGAPLDWYYREWIKDIDEGLKAWPEASLEIAQALFFGPEFPGASVGSTVGRYTTDHLLSMLSYPDIVGQAIGVAVDVLDAMVPDAIGEMARDLGEWLFLHAFGIPFNRYVELVSDPRQYFDSVMTYAPSGRQVTVRDFTMDEMGMVATDTRFTPDRFPPAYNTVVMTKLLLLDQREANRLLGNLGGSAQLRTPNAMLGFVTSMDDDNQWQDGAQMAFARERGVYRQIFMDQRGVNDGASIAGVVTDEKTGNPVEGITVEIGDPSGANPPVRQAVTASDGSYELPWLAPGASPLIRFFDPATKYASEWWRDTTPDGAVPVRVAAGDTLIPGIDAALALVPPVSVSGIGPGNSGAGSGNGGGQPGGGGPPGGSGTGTGTGTGTSAGTGTGTGAGGAGSGGLSLAPGGCAYTVIVEGEDRGQVGDRMVFTRLFGRGAQLMLQSTRTQGVLTISMTQAPRQGKPGTAVVEGGGGTLGVPPGVLYEFRGGTVRITEDQGGRFAASATIVVEISDGRQKPETKRPGSLRFRLRTTNSGPLDIGAMANGAGCVVGQ